MPVNFSGTWMANLSQSKIRGALPAAIVAHIQHADPEMQQELVITREDGSEARAVFLCRTDGDQTKTELNGSPIRGGARWEGDELVMETWVQLGSHEMHLCDRWSLSADGRTLTMEHRDGDLAGQRTVFDRTK